MIKLLDIKTRCAYIIKVKFVRNTEFLDITNNSSGLLIFSEDEALGVVDQRSVGYYKVKQSIIQPHIVTLCCWYHVTLCSCLLCSTGGTTRRLIDLTITIFI